MYLHENVLSFSFCDTGRNNTNANFRNEFDRDTGLGVGAFEIVDQLCEVLDRVDVVVGWRRDQSNSGNGVTSFGDIFRDFVAGKFSSFTGFGSLRHLDLQLVGVGQVGGRYSESSGSDLLDGRSLVEFGILVEIPVNDQIL